LFSPTLIGLNYHKFVLVLIQDLDILDSIIVSFGIVSHVVHVVVCTADHSVTGPSWSWSHSSWIYNYLCNQCLSPLKLWVSNSCSWWGLLDATLCDKVCQCVVAGRRFSPGTPVFTG